MELKPTRRFRDGRKPTDGDCVMWYGQMLLLANGRLKIGMTVTRCPFRLILLKQNGYPVLALDNITVAVFLILKTKVSYRLRKSLTALWP